ncbi:MAG: hypothetical protein SGI86_04045 [Deltaproteobacteria bacterium]|nr:hypothetical protein [Deltaproteobacteria bacterium]
MPVSSLVVTLLPSELLRKQIVDGLSADARVTLGLAQDFAANQLVPVVLETETIGEARDTAEAIAAMDGVAQVELVGVDFSDLDDCGTQTE